MFVRRTLTIVRSVPRTADDGRPLSPFDTTKLIPRCVYGSRMRLGRGSEGAKTKILYDLHRSCVLTSGCTPPHPLSSLRVRIPKLGEIHAGNI